MSIVRGLRTEGIEVNCYTEAFERLQGIIPSSRKKLIPGMHMMTATIRKVKLTINYQDFCMRKRL